MNDKKPGSLFGMILKYIIAIEFVLVIIYLISFLVAPVFEKIGESVLLKNDLMEINTKYSDRFVELQDAISKRSAKKAIGG